MAAELVDRLAILVAVRRFRGMGAIDSRLLRANGYVCMQHFVRRTTLFLFGVFGEMCGESSCNVFLKLFMVLWVPIYLRDALHAGSADVVACLPVPRAQVFPFFLLFAWWPPLLFLVRNGIIYCSASIREHLIPVLVTN
jgi:hypothetical protein